MNPVGGRVHCANSNATALSNGGVDVFNSLTDAACEAGRQKDD